jgi:DNA-binding FrmR family transcriptional regulator
LAVQKRLNRRFIPQQKILDFLTRILYLIPVGGIWRLIIVIDQNAKTEALARLKKVEGQVRGIQRMIEERRYCIDVVMQLTAAEAALHKVAESILKNHLETCVLSAFRSDDEKDRQAKVDELMRVYSQLSPR